MLTTKRVFIVLVLILAFAIVVFAQPGDPQTDPDQVPITGLELLLGAGALLGAKRIYSRIKKNNNIPN